jgi:hypothetical protein
MFPQAIVHTTPAWFFTLAEHADIISACLSQDEVIAKGVHLYFFDIWIAYYMANLPAIRPDVTVLRLGLLRKGFAM